MSEEYEKGGASGLASATLARLYARQGHLPRAREVLAEVLSQASAQIVAESSAGSVDAVASAASSGPAAEASSRYAEALVLASRIRACDPVARPRIEARAESALELRWSFRTRAEFEALAAGAAPPGLSLVLCACPNRPRLSPILLSGPIERAIASRSLPFPHPSGSVVASLVRLCGARRELEILAVSERVSW